MKNPRTQALPNGAVPAHSEPPENAAIALSMLDTPPAASRTAPVLAGAATIGVHAALVGLAALIGAGVSSGEVPTMVSEMIEIELPEPEPEVPEPEVPEPEVPEPEVPEPEPSEPEPEPPPREPPASSQPHESEKPLRAERTETPAAAQAGKVLTAADELIDFGDRFVVGRGRTYAGSTTDARGASKRAVRKKRAGGSGTKRKLARLKPKPAPDLSRPPQLTDGDQWDCPFPAEAEISGVNQAMVQLRVQVSASGSVDHAHALRDPGHGFARQARRCALDKRWSPGLDRAGRPRSGVAVINVRFTR